eukprot:TRINITY_DN1091_c0_g1_i1.p1 TRINITY_DN1091_c0_g1~~TRINITY_DN1091_c0_g1_i1.p1  ORF type:complete len:411 (+),score=38.69 TRINITY_DN1091_c0_g1_i1:211-1443(+)
MSILGSSGFSDPMLNDEEETAPLRVQYDSIQQDYTPTGPTPETPTSSPSSTFVPQKNGHSFPSIDWSSVSRYAQPKEKRFLYIFPMSLEKKLEFIDDPLIKWCQRLDHRVWFYINMLITGFVAIEIGIGTPFILLLLGWDGLAVELTYLALTLALVSQIPKRFVWRFRPYMVRRAQMVKEDKTSSFPSRAVTCAVVYSYAFVWGMAYNSGTKLSVHWWMPVICLITVFLASFARVNLGVHYPTDCIAGFLQGIIVCLIGTGIWKTDIIGCSSCREGLCYATELEHTISFKQLYNVNWGVFVGTIIITVVVTMISQVKPIEYWSKCIRVYGMLFPAILFQILFLCPEASHNSSSIVAPHSPRWYTYFVGLIIAGLATVFGTKFDSKHPILVFVVLYAGLFFTLFVWRLSGA